jgi:N-acetylmuramoyl-L-alanine amidase
LSLLKGPKREASEPRTAEAAPATASYSPDDFELVEIEPSTPAQTVESEGTWKITSLQGRDYLPLSQVAAFYKLNMEVDGDTATLKSASRHMAFKANSRLARVDFIKQWLSFPALYSDGSFYISRMDLSKTIEPLMRPHQTSGLQPVTTVVLDPAHGGDDSGAVNRYGSEKNYTLDVSRRIRAYLQKAGLKVVITRNGDNLPSAEARAAVATQLNQKESGSIFVSLHFNASTKKDSPDTGFEIFTLTPLGAPNTGEDFFTEDNFSAEPGHLYNPASTALASAIYHAMLGRVPMFDNGAKRVRATELRLTSAPAVSIQGGFISHPRDAHLLHSVEWRERLAESIALGILEFCSLAATRERPKLLIHYRHEAANAVPDSSEFDKQAMELREKLLKKSEP